MRFKFDPKKSARLKKERGISFKEAQEMFDHPHYIEPRIDDPNQSRAIGWVGGRLYTVIYELRYDKQGEYHHLVTLWKATKEEQQLYEENA